MKHSLALILIVAAAVSVFAETDNFPDALYARVSPDLFDLRIVGVRESGERFEVPYLLRAMRADVEKSVGFTLINRTTASGGHYFTFEVPTAEAVNEIALTFGKENFDWRVRLEGSADQKAWFGVVDDYRIVAFKNNFTSYSFTTLRFPDAKFRFFRLFVPSSDDPGFEQAAINVRRRDDSARRVYPVKSMKVAEDKPYRVTVVDIELADRVPLDGVRAKVRDTVDYYRPVSIEYVSGMNADKQPIYRRGAADIISSFDAEGFRFPVFLADRLRLTISNQDSPALDFESFEISGTPYEIIGQFPENARFFLVYGKPDTAKPQYDIVNFKDRIPVEVRELSLGDEQVSGDAAQKPEPVMSSPVWLWPVMLAAIALMGLFAFRMLRQ